MSEGFLWFFLSCKRYLKKMSFFLILLALPIATFLIRKVERTQPQEIRIAVCIQKEDTYRDENMEDSLEQLLIDNLVNKRETSGNSFFRFYQCEGEEQVKEQVASRRAECGYVISQGLRGKLDEKNYKRSIYVYSAPSTVLASLSTEVVFSSLMEVYGSELFQDYVLEQHIVSEAAASLGVDERQLNEEVSGLYEKWMGNGSTFHFQYRQSGANGLYKDPQQTLSVFPVRGLIAVYLLVVGLYSAVMLGLDEKRGLFLPLPYGRQRRCRIAVLGAPVFLASLSGFAGLVSGGCIQGLGKEVGAMAAYCGGVCLFSYGVKLICRKPEAVCSLIPLFLAGSLIFTPVFVDMGQYFPLWGWAGRLFLPWYYLRWF